MLCLSIWEILKRIQLEKEFSLAFHIRKQSFEPWSSLSFKFRNLGHVAFKPSYSVELQLTGTSGNWQVKICGYYKEMYYEVGIEF